MEKPFLWLNCHGRSTLPDCHDVLGSSRWFWSYAVYFRSICETDEPKVGVKVAVHSRFGCVTLLNWSHENMTLMEHKMIQSSSFNRLSLYTRPLEFYILRKHQWTIYTNIFTLKELIFLEKWHYYNSGAIYLLGRTGTVSKTDNTLKCLHRRKKKRKLCNYI